MTYWAYLTAPIRTHDAKQILDASASRAWECVQIAPCTKPKLAEVGTAIHDVEPTVMAYQSAVRDRHLLVTSGQLYIEGPCAGRTQWPTVVRDARQWPTVVRDAYSGRPLCGTHTVADRCAGRTQWPTVVRDAYSGRPLCGTHTVADRCAGRIQWPTGQGDAGAAPNADPSWESSLLTVGAGNATCAVRRSTTT